MQRIRSSGNRRVSSAPQLLSYTGLAYIKKAPLSLGYGPPTQSWHLVGTVDSVHMPEPVNAAKPHGQAR